MEAYMNLTSLLANKCFEYLLKCNSNRENERPQDSSQQKTINKASSRSIFTPPWTVETKLFRSLCDGCGECVSSCGNNIVILGEDGYPGVDFSLGPCNFCGLCAQSCPQGALCHNTDIAPWNLRVFITGTCLVNERVLCRSCADQCEKKAIVHPIAIIEDQAPQILSAKCNGCGACFASCPVGAIAFEDREYQE
jgi:ferredoxin-type protein NapF